MIHFNELYITEDGKGLVVDAEVDNLPGYEDCYIEKIELDTGDTCGKSKLFSDAITIWEPDEIVVGDIDDDGKLTDNDFTLLKYLMILCKQNRKSNHSQYETDVPGLYFKDNLYYCFVLTEDSESSTDFKTEYINIGDSVYKLAKHIIDDYEDIITMGDGSMDGLCEGKMLSFMTQEFNKDTYVALGGKYSGVIGDINGDEESSINDFNTLVDFILTLDPSSDTYNADQQYIFIKKVKRVRKCFSRKEIFPNMKSEDFANSMFFIKVTAGCDDWDAVEQMGCGYDDCCIKGIVYNDKPIYDSAINYASNLGDNCDDNAAKIFQDFILRYFAFKYAIKVGDLCKAWEYYNNFLKGNTSITHSFHKRCCCHGAHR